MLLFRQVENNANVYLLKLPHTELRYPSNHMANGNFPPIQIGCNVCYCRTISQPTALVCSRESYSHWCKILVLTKAPTVSIYVY